MPTVARDSLRTVCCLALCAVLALITSACGSAKQHAKPSFVTSFRAAESDYRAELGSLQQQAPALLGQDIAKQLTLIQGMSNATTHAVTAMTKLTPPANVATVYSQLVGVLTKQQTTLAQIEKSAQANDQAGLTTSLTGYASDLQTGISLLHQMDDGLAAPSTSTTPATS